MPGHNQEQPTSTLLEPQDHSTNLLQFKELQPQNFPRFIKANILSKFEEDLY